MKKILIIHVLTIATVAVNAQLNNDFARGKDTTIAKSPFLISDALTTRDKSRRILPFLLPGGMVTYGLVTLGNKGLKNINAEIKEDLWTEDPHKQIHIDNYLMFLPAAFVYGLNATGAHGKNNFRDRTMIYLLSNVIVNTTVFSIKKATHQLRPDGSDYFSFPSGHTAQAFASAEFLYQEYKDVSPGYGMAGYAIATVAGYLRLYNNKHWFSDVVAGAGFGILSVKIAYWIYPVIKRNLFKANPVKTMIMPYYQNKGAGLSLIYNLNH